MDADKVFSWISNSYISDKGEASPLRYNGWWVQYPKPSCSKLIPDPPVNQRPIFQIGDFVRLVGKPELLRQVIKIEWHCHRYEFVYIVETSASEYRYPYWFAPQLVLELQTDQDGSNMK